MKADDRTWHLHVNLFTQNGQLHAHALEPGVSVEADGITNALRKLADEIDNQRSVEHRSGTELDQAGAKRPRT